VFEIDRNLSYSEPGDNGNIYLTENFYQFRGPQAAITCFKWKLLFKGKLLPVYRTQVLSTCFKRKLLFDGKILPVARTQASSTCFKRKHLFNRKILPVPMTQASRNLF